MKENTRKAIPQQPLDASPSPIQISSNSNTLCNIHNHNSAINQPILQNPGTPILQNRGAPILQNPGTPILQNPGAPILQNPGTPILQNPGTPILQNPENPILQNPGTPILQNLRKQSPTTSSSSSSNIKKMIKSFGAVVRNKLSKKSKSHHQSLKNGPGWFYNIMKRGIKSVLHQCISY